MSSPQIRRFTLLLVALLMLIAGLALIGRVLVTLSVETYESFQLAPAVASSPLELPTATVPFTTTPSITPSFVATSKVGQTSTAAPTKIGTATRVPSPTPVTIPLTITVAEGLPKTLKDSLGTLQSQQRLVLTTTIALSTAALRFDWDGLNGAAFYTQTFVAATRFDTIDPTIDWESIGRMWHGEALTFTTIALLTDTLPALQQKLGPAGGLIEAHATLTDLLVSAWDDRTTLVLLPFDQLVPRLTVLAIDGQNPVENSAYFDSAKYPFTATVYLHENPQTPAKVAEQTTKLFAQLPRSNRDPALLTVVAMTGVTAMARMMGAQMDELGSGWPAEVVGADLAAADLTIFSNEVAFAPDCETNANPNVLLFCSKPEYWETLEKSGVDLISLTGNHINDWGRQSLSWSLDFYAEKAIPVYGGGIDAAAAVKPRIVEHNGNRLAFLGSNSVGPYAAWASDSLPGAARFDFAQASQLIDQARNQEHADLVFYDLQYLESYDTWPLIDQRNTFNILLRDGADVVTGVQAHVPQSLEFTDGKLILFGLGNLYFDQMWGEATRQGLIAKHTIYNGRHLSTQILVTVLYEYGQPHWATAEQRQEILQRVFAASYW